jgi:predicted unusual protein kinase regulating ubiquinone biosynthesis (AarF/ABC1/UbiB family)
MRPPRPRRRLLVGLALAAAAAAAAAAGCSIAALRRRRQRGRRQGGQRQGGRAAVHQRSRLARNARMAGVGARTGRDYALHRARRRFAAAERRQALDTAFEVRTAEQVAEALGHMKGALMKLGQMASYLDQGLPEHVRAALAELRHDAPPMSAELAAQVVTAELGAPPEAVFAEWDPVPIASASIGQVHRAITHDGEAVAVKVQYPGVDEAVSADLGNLGLVFAGLGQLFPGLDHGPLVEELRDRLVEELDYEREADNQRLFAAHYADHPYISVPRVVDDLSTRRVLTTELAEGEGWDVLLTWDQHQRDLAAETIYRFVFGSLYRLGAFNGDPHPGNYLFLPGGRVTFLDFGLVKRFTPEELVPFEEMIRAMVLEPDPARFRQVVEGAGLLRPGMAFGDDQVVDYFGHFYEFVKRDAVETITSEYASENIRRFFDKAGPHGEIMSAANLPPSMVVIQRINLGIYALFGELGATANWRRLAEETWPWMDGPPSTPMGRRIAATAWTTGAGPAALEEPA